MRLVAVLMLCGLIAACGKKETPPPTPTSPPPATVDTTTPEPEADVATATPEDTVEPSVEADTTEAAVDTVAPTTDDSAKDWLVWSRSGDGWVTRWVALKGSRFEVVAERKAVIVSDGTKLFRVARADVEENVKPCECFEEEDGDACKVIGTITRPRLRAFDLAGGDPIDVYVPDAGEMYGGDMDLGVDLVGGVGTLLFVDWTEGGYFCGAHGMWDKGTRLYDVAQRKSVQDLFREVDGKLPAAIRTPAMKELYEPLRECDNEELTEAEAAERMGLDGVYVRVGEGGAPAIRWAFSADVMYACSADYLVHGSSTSSLLPEAAALGLDGPLPKGLLAAFDAAPEKGTVGWSALTVEGDARAAALAAFEAAPEPAWGKTHFSEKLSETDAPSGDTAAAKAAVSEGRKLTRKKDYPGAVTKFTAAIEADGSYARAYSGRGYARMLAGDLDEAKADFGKALELGGDEAYQAQVHFNLGQIAEKQKDLSTAKAAYEKSLELRPNDAVKKALDRVTAE